MSSKQNLYVVGFIASILIILANFLYAQSLTESQWVYPLDDTYIHMSIGKNIANHGVWGVTANQFAPASSSILYSILMAGGFVFTDSIYLPIYLNVIALLLLFVCLYFVSKGLKWERSTDLIMIAAIIILVPVHTLVLSGMEHVWQLAINVLAFYVLSKSFVEDKQRGVSILFVGILLTFIRFEGLFITAVAASIFVLQGKHKSWMLLSLGALIPIVTYGVFAYLQGGFPVPNSVLIKADKPTLDLLGMLNYVQVWLRKMEATHYLYGLFMMLFFSVSYFVHREQKLGFWGYYAILLAGTTVLHLTFARTGWLYRYDAYIIALAVITIVGVGQSLAGELKKQHLFTKLALGFGVFLLLHPLLVRTGQASLETPQASKNIYEQQIQMAKFVHEYFDGKAIAVNDIGAVAYFNDIELLDLYGLASMDIARLRASKQYNKAGIQQVLSQQSPSLMIIYDGWFEGMIPEGWQKVGEWKISNNVICAFENVSFYAPSEEQTSELKSYLKAFEDKLPSEINVSYVSETDLLTQQ
ncbi:hypothetical protein V6R21_29710 [Limibacter armeniacum]|uniref:hypothetical protein n=1 Tax=Limibacter armeniacum TaxID=466084 RepID=UPI002FE52F59